MQLTKEDIAYLRAMAAQRGYTQQNADDMLRGIQYESSGDPSRWGGKGNDYFGLIQFGPNERKQFNIDTVHPNARNQIDGMFGFFKQRGYKPGMPLIDLYSTINAGSPGHYKASDGSGTVASHVAKMIGMKLPQGASAAPGLSLAGDMPEDEMSYTGKRSDPIGELLAMTSGTQQKPNGNLTQFVGSLLAEPEQQAGSTNDAFLRQMRDFHNAQHMRAVQGLL